MTKPIIDIHKPADDEIIGEGAERIRETRQGLYDIFPIAPDDLDYEETANWWPAGSLTGGQAPGIDNNNPPTDDTFQDRAFLIGQTSLRYDYDIPEDHNAITPGPIDTGTAVVTVPADSTWVVVGTEDTAVQYLRDLEDVSVDLSSDGDALIYDHPTNSWYASPAPGGPEGPTGPEGPQGIQGSPGPIGPEGPIGMPGAGIQYKGNVATVTALPGYPNSYSGAVGDAYYVEDQGALYAWDGANWDNLGQIVGPQGPEGPQGIQGPQGVEGPRGPEGERGDAATLNVGTTSTGLPGTNAQVVNVGTTADAVFSFTIPRGADGGDPKNYTLGAGAGPTIDLDDDEGGKSSVSVTGGANIDTAKLSAPDAIEISADLTDIDGPVTVHTVGIANPFAITGTTGQEFFKVYASGTMSGGNQRFADIGTPSSDNDAATKKYVDDSDDLGVTLDNEETWEHGQYNVTHEPASSGSGMSTRFAWDAEVYPNVLLDKEGDGFIADPSDATVDGMFIAITWKSHNTGQSWLLDTQAFGPNVVAPADIGVDVIRIFHSMDGKWYDV